MTVVRRQRVAKWARRRTTAALAVAFTAEECDKVLLTSMYLAIGNTLRALPSQLGQLTMWRALVQAIFIPVVGILGNEFNRVYIISSGNLVWGGMSVGFGFANNMTQATAWAALSGIGLALVLPCVQAIVAELYTAFERGRAFGTLFTVSALGGVVGSFCAISFGNRYAGGIPVWRIMFWAMAALAVLTFFLVLANAVEPRSYYTKVADSKGDAAEGANSKAGAERSAAAAGVWERCKVIGEGVWLVFRTPSFLLILLGNIIGTIVGNNMGYKIMYMQLLGFSDLATGALAVCASIGAAMGFLLGGGVGDFLAMKYPNIARPAVNQISLLFAGPLYVIFLKALPGTSRHASGYPGSLDHLTPVYGITILLVTFFSAWPVSNNAAIFAEVVPERVRTSVYAFDKCIAGAIGALGAPLCGILAERLFGYHGVAGGEGKHSHRDPHISPARAIANLNNAHALENGLLWMTVVPLVLKFIIYGGLYWTLPRDRVEEVEMYDPEEEEEGSDEDRPKDAEAQAKPAPDTSRGSDPSTGSGAQGLEQRAPTLGRAVSLRRRLHGRELGMRYASLDASTLRREAIRGLLNPSNKPASQLNALAVFAGAAFDVSYKDTARTSQSKADLDRAYRKTGSVMVSRGDLADQLGAYKADKAKLRNFTSLPAAVSANWREQLRSAPPVPHDNAPDSIAHASNQSMGQTLELSRPRLTQQDRQAAPPPGLPKFRASGEPVRSLDDGSAGEGQGLQGFVRPPRDPPMKSPRPGGDAPRPPVGDAATRSARATPPAWELDINGTPARASRVHSSLPSVDEHEEGGEERRAAVEAERRRGAEARSRDAK